MLYKKITNNTSERNWLEQAACAVQAACAAQGACAAQCRTPSVEGQSKEMEVEEATELGTGK